VTVDQFAGIPVRNYAAAAAWYERLLGIVMGDDPAVEWWDIWTEAGQDLTFAGVSVLRFNGAGKVVKHRDYDNHVNARQSPYAGWLSL
jgi:hypothetical protein